MKIRRNRMIPFGYKLLISYWVFVLIPVIAVGYFSYTSNVDTIQKQTQKNISGTLKQMRDNIEYKTDSFTKMANQIFFDEGMQVLLTKQFRNYESYEQTSRYLIPKLSSTLYLAENRALIKIYLDNPTLPEVYFEQSNENPLARGTYFEIFQQKRIEQQDWYKQLDLVLGKTEWRQVDTDEKFGNISLLRNMVDFVTKREEGFLRIVGSMDEIFKAVDYQKIASNSHLMILDEHGNLLLQSGEVELPKDWQNQSDSYLIIQEPLQSLQWQMIALVPLSSLENNAKQVRYYTMIVCLISFAVLAVIGLFVANYFSKRVKKIVATLKSFQIGQFQKRITYKGNDELSLIASAFNGMAQNIQELVQQVYVVNLEKKEAELMVMQAQISPHFLYNTLSSISRLAKLGEVEKLHEMVIGLAQFYRLTLNNGRSMISVYNEIQQVQAYIRIQEIKFMERMEVQYDFHPDIVRYDTIKIILQPFVENILEHALCGDRIHVRLVGYLDQGNIVFKVIDDGLGMTEERIKGVFAGKGKRSGGYGIRNVDQRLKLQYGEKYGVTIYSRLGIGTTVQIVFPASKTGEA